MPKLFADAIRSVLRLFPLLLQLNQFVLERMIFGEEFRRLLLLLLHVGGYFVVRVVQLGASGDVFLLKHGPIGFGVLGQCAATNAGVCFNQVVNELLLDIRRRFAAFPLTLKIAERKTQS